MKEGNNMQLLLDFITNPCVTIPLAAWIIAQIVKTIVNFCMTKELNFERLIGDGGMPSCHSAVVMALTVMCGITYGFSSGIFAISFILATVVMHDATGVRRETGKQAATLKRLAELVNSAIADPDEHVRTEKLKELVGHSPLQVVMGGILGASVAILAYFIFDLPSVY